MQATCVQHPGQLAVTTSLLSLNPWTCQSSSWALEVAALRSSSFGHMPRISQSSLDFAQVEQLEGGYTRTCTCNTIEDRIPSEGIVRIGISQVMKTSSNIPGWMTLLSNGRCWSFALGRTGRSCHAELCPQLNRKYYHQSPATNSNSQSRFCRARWHVSACFSFMLRGGKRLRGFPAHDHHSRFRGSSSVKRASCMKRPT